VHVFLNSIGVDTPKDTSLKRWLLPVVGHPSWAGSRHVTVAATRSRPCIPQVPIEWFVVCLPTIPLRGEFHL
jgi:hypothetical protein